MSKCQFINFIAIDSPVSDNDLEYMEKQSTRADISKWRFTNEWHISELVSAPGRCDRATLNGPPSTPRLRERSIKDTSRITQ